VRLVGAVVKTAVDIPTLVPWSLEFHVSVSTIKRYCKACGVQAADSLDFARGLRIVFRHAGRQVDAWYDTLEIRDPKTMAKFLHRAGFCSSWRRAASTSVRGEATIHCEDEPR
jgi:hypothetical protein